MKSRNEYTEDFREQALKKVYARGDRSVKSVADELHMSHKTLGNWMSAKQGSGQLASHDRPLSERLQLLMGSHGLTDEALNGNCREKGIFRHQLKEWQTVFESGATSSAAALIVRELKETNRRLNRELTRNGKALAEAAALLVLQKKHPALWEEKDV